MRRILLLSILLSLSTFSTALAQDAKITPPEDPPISARAPEGALRPISARAPEGALRPISARPKPARFSLGAGIGFVGYGDVSGLAGLAGLAGAAGATSALSSLNSSYAGSRTPFGTSLFEVLGTPHWRFVLGLSGSYTKHLNGDEESFGMPESAWHLSGSLGARYVLNPGGTVEISPLVTVGSFRSLATDIKTGAFTETGAQVLVATRDIMTLGYDARLGLVLEHALLSNLYLRFETYFFRASYAKAGTRDITHGTEEIKERYRRDFSLGYGLSPVLQLRLTF